MHTVKESVVASAQHISRQHKVNKDNMTRIKVQWSIKMWPSCSFQNLIGHNTIFIKPR